MGFYYFNYTYLLFLLPAMVISLIAQMRVKSTFHRYSQVRNFKGLTGVAAVGVAAHEAGHAVQYATGYAPIKFRTAIYPMVSIGSNLSMPLLILGLLLPVQYSYVVYIGIALYSLSVLFTLVTLPVEFNASARALSCLKETGMLTTDELAGAKKVLTAAAMTYVAAAFTALLSLLRLLVIFGNRRGRSG